MSFIYNEIYETQALVELTLAAFPTPQFGTDVS